MKKTSVIGKSLVIILIFLFGAIGGYEVGRYIQTLFHKKELQIKNNN